MASRSPNTLAAPAPAITAPRLVLGAIPRLDGASGSVPLTRSEACVLETLAHAGGETVSRADLQRALYPGGEVVVPRVVDVHVASLRRKLGDPARRSRWIGTVHRRGYRLLKPIQM